MVRIDVPKGCQNGMRPITSFVQIEGEALKIFSLRSSLAGRKCHQIETPKREGGLGA
jgi:hypothetical protein